MKNKTIIKYSILILVLLPFLILFFTINGITKKSATDVGFIVAKFDGMYSYDNQTWHTLGNKDIKLHKNTTLWVKGSFKDEIDKNDYIWFRVENIGLKVSVDGKEELSVQQVGSFPSFMSSPGSGFYKIKSSGISANISITFEILSYGEHSKVANILFQNIYVGDGLGIYQMLLSNIDVFAIISLVAIFAGLIYMMEGTVYDLANMEEGRRIQLLGFYLFSGGLWSVADSVYPYIPLFFQHSWIVPVIDMTGELLFPVALAFLVRYFIQDKKRKLIMNVVTAGALVTLTLSALILLMGIKDLYQQELWIGCVGFACLSISFVCVCLDLKKYKRGYMLWLLLAILPTFVAILAECMNIVFNFMPTRSLIRCGFSISVVLMITQLISYAKTDLEVKKSVEIMKEEIVKSKISIMLSQIQPHFLYNALESIGDMCTRSPKVAEDAITDFSLFLRGNLDSLASEELIPFEKELEHTKYYLKLEKLRFGDRLYVKIDVDTTNFRLPCLTLQPIVENAVRYGVTRRKKGGCVTITTSQDAVDYIIMVKDDGVGFDQTKQMDSSRSHVGLHNVRNRLEIQCRGSLEIHSVIDEGTTVIIRIPKEGFHELENNRN